MIGGIIVGTLLTLVFLPSLYVVWFRIAEPESSAPAATSDPAVQSPMLAVRELA